MTLRKNKRITRLFILSTLIDYSISRCAQLVLLLLPWLNFNRSPIHVNRPEGELFLIGCRCNWTEREIWKKLRKKQNKRHKMDNHSKLYNYTSLTCWDLGWFGCWKGHRCNYRSRGVNQVVFSSIQPATHNCIERVPSSLYYYYWLLHYFYYHRAIIIIIGRVIYNAGYTCGFIKTLE